MVTKEMVNDKLAALRTTHNPDDNPKNNNRKKCSNRSPSGNARRVDVSGLVKTEPRANGEENQPPKNEENEGPEKKMSNPSETHTLMRALLMKHLLMSVHNGGGRVLFSYNNTITHNSGTRGRSSNGFVGLKRTLRIRHF